MIQGTAFRLAAIISVASIVLAVAAVVNAAGPEATSGDYVVACTQQLNIRTGPSTESLVVGRAEKGDLFLHAGGTPDWFEIVLISGDTRYVSRRYAARLAPSQILPGHDLALPATHARRRELMASVDHALERAQREAQQLLPESLDAQRHQTLRRILEDHHALRVFHLYGVHTALFPELVGELGRPAAPDGGSNRR